MPDLSKYRNKPIQDPDMLDLIDQLDNCEEEVTDLECEFLISFREQIVNGRVLTGKQRAILERMEKQYMFGEDPWQ